MPSSDLTKKTSGDRGPRLLFIEPYLTSSHRALAEGLLRHVPARWTLLGMPGRNFRWRMRGAPAFLASQAKEVLAQPWDGLICSDMLNLAELRGLVPQLAQVPSLLYFHENQITYPDTGRGDDRQRERDLYLAFSNLTSALAADQVVFNSAYHQDQFLAGGQELLDKMPDAVPAGVIKDIQAKSSVLPVPLDTSAAKGLQRQSRQGALRLVWNHRWEEEKGPDELFDALFLLADEGVEFEAAIIGPRAATWPRVFDQARERMGERLNALGPEESGEAYWRRLLWADVVISTARQEFQGLALAEGVYAGCRPLAPDRLVYPSMYPGRYLYQEGDLHAALKELCLDPDSVRAGEYPGLVEDLTWQRQTPHWRVCLSGLIGHDSH
jgi:glycosyltransferase involved in cell wall biosynthesis